MTNRLRLASLAVLAAAALLVACGPRQPPLPPARPSLDPATASPAGTPDPRAAKLAHAKTEPDPVARAALLAEIARGAPPSDHLARQARVALVRTWAEAGRLDEMHRAAGELEIADDSEGADLLNVMAYAYAEKGEHLDRALQYSRRALEIVLSLSRPEAMPSEIWKRQIAAVLAAYRDTLGWVLFKGGDHRSAARELRQAAEVLPDDPTVNWHYGQALLAVGKPKEALAALVRSAIAEGDESGAARTLAFDAAQKAGIPSSEVEAQLARARAELEARVREAALGRRISEMPRELTLPDEHGNALRVLPPADRRPVLLLFWGSFSRPSVKALRALRGVDAARARVVGISLDRDPVHAAAVFREAVPGAELGLDPEAKHAEAFQVRGLPTLLVLDAHGRVRYRNEGISPGYEIQWKAQLDSLGDEP